MPSGWDSWGKIRVLREGFDVEGINVGWSVDIAPSGELEGEIEGGAVEIYEDVIKDTKRSDTEGLALLKARGLEIPPVDTQEFLLSQMEILEAKAAEEKTAKGVKEDQKPARQESQATERVTDHVGPVQFNVGGIQVDADYTLERLKVRMLFTLMVRWVG